jgi:hypothetical protein
MRSSPLAIVLLVLSSGLPPCAAQATWYVHGSGTYNTGNGSSGNPFGAIQQAIDAASNGDSILVLPASGARSRSLRPAART